MLYSFGDSFTFGLCRDLPASDSPLTNVRVQNNFTSLVATHYNIPYKNFGIPGMCNQEICDELATNLGNFNKGDMVIIGLSAGDRFMLPVDNVSDIDPFRENIKPVMSIYWGLEESIDYRRRVITNGTPNGRNLSRKRQNLMIESIDNFKEGIYTYHQDHFDAYYLNHVVKVIQSFQNRGIKFVLWDYLWWDLIKKEVNSSCSCKHWDEKGHTLFSKYLIEAFDNDNPYLLSTSSNMNPIWNQYKNV